VIYCQSPLRLSLAGGGTDVEPFSSNYGSCVLNFTIKDSIKGVLRDLENSKKSTAFQVSVMSPNQDEVEGSSRNRNKFEVSLERNLNKVFGNKVRRPIAIELSSPVAPGSGLGTSSSIVATAIHLIRVFLSEPTDPYTIASDAYDLERNQMKISGGFQDQFATTFGGVLFLRKQTSKIEVENLNLSRAFLESLEDSLFLINLGISRSGEKIIDKQIRNVRDSRSLTIDALVEQITIAKRMRLAMINESLAEVAFLMQEAWTCKRNFAREISNEQIDSIIEVLLDLGALGVKVSGAGGGGHLMCLAPENLTIRNEIQNYLQACRLEYRSIQISEKGSSVWM